MKTDLEPYNDNTLMPFGQYKGVKLANVPNSYLQWLYEETKCPKRLKKYIEDYMNLGPKK